MTLKEFNKLEEKLKEELGEYPFGFYIIKVLKIRFPKQAEKLNSLCDKCIKQESVFNNEGILYLKLLEKLTFKK